MIVDDPLAFPLDRFVVDTDLHSLGGFGSLGGDAARVGRRWPMPAIADRNGVAIVEWRQFRVVVAECRPAGLPAERIVVAINGIA